jgi:hypothetical protein
MAACERRPNGRVGARRATEEDGDAGRGCDQRQQK